MCFIIKVLISSLSLGLFLLIFASDLEVENNFAYSVVDMKTLLGTDKFLIRNIARYSAALEKKFNIVSRAVKEMELENSEAVKDAEKYLGHPLKSFALIRRLSVDWPKWIKYLEKPVGEEFIKSMESADLKKVTVTDLNQAIKGIQRLQVVYGLEAESVANGLLNGIQYDARLTIIDAFFIGATLINSGNIDGGMEWMETGLRIPFDAHSYDDVFGMNIQLFYEYYKNAAKTLEIPSKDLESIKANKSIIKTEPIITDLDDVRIESLNLKFGLNVRENITSVFNSYVNNCRGITLKKLSKYYCSYMPYTSYFLTIGPLKMEKLYSNPSVILFYDVLTDTDIEALKRMSRNELRLTKVFSEKAGKYISSNVRSAKVFFLNETKASSYALANRMANRVVEMTGYYDRVYSLPSIVNYGIGGHYGLHADFLTNKEADTKDHGNRLATVIFYLSDVEQGGATIFPLIDVSVLPKKGAALVWRNLYRNGTPNYDSMHSSCPVLVGSKWVTAMWVQEKFDIYTV